MIPTLAIWFAFLGRTAAATVAWSPDSLQSPPDRLLIHGHVVDDETGRPIESFALETGRGKGLDPLGYSWSTGRIVPNSYRIVNGKPVVTERNLSGEFRDGLEIGEDHAGRRAWLRILVDGYEPRTIPDQPPGPDDGGKSIEVTLRLKRGPAILGKVVDHLGRPVAGARLFLIRPVGFSIRVVDEVIGEGSDTGLLDPGVTRATADAEGHFRITGVGDAIRIGVCTPSVYYWSVPIGAQGEDMTIHLPEPATIRLPYTIAGDEAETRFQLLFLEPEGHEHRVWIQRNLRLPNGGEVVVRDLTPGRWTLWRLKELVCGNYHRPIGIDRREITVGRGAAAVADFVRQSGGPIRGKVIGPAVAQSRTLFVGIEPVLPALVDGKPVGPPPLVDVVGCDRDGGFQTARIPPGEYLVRVEGYRTEPRYNPFHFMGSMPNFLGSVRVKVPPDGGPPDMEIRLSDRDHERLGPPRDARRDTPHSIEYAKFP